MCIDRLRIAYDFRLVCIQSDQKLCKYVEHLSINGKHNNNSDDSTFNIPSKFSSSNLETFDTEKQQNVDYVQLKHFLENDEEISTSKNIVSARCNNPNNTYTGRYVKYDYFALDVVLLLSLFYLRHYFYQLPFCC